jgi:hypothetical protein
VGANSSAEDTIQAGARYALGGVALGILAAAVLSRNYKGDLPPTEALLFRDGKRWAFGVPKLSVEPAHTPEGATTRLFLTLAKGSW